MHHSRRVSWLTCWAALGQQFLQLSVAQRKAIGEPNYVLDDRHPEPVAIGVRISHGGSAYSDPVEATYPFEHVPHGIYTSGAMTA